MDQQSRPLLEYLSSPQNVEEDSGPNFPWGSRYQAASSVTGTCTLRELSPQGRYTLPSLSPRIGVPQVHGTNRSTHTNEPSENGVCNN